jgi:hypothetical protein
MVSFLNSTRPDPPSFLRQEAYRDHISLLGPTEDPDGWQAVEPVNICGRVFGDRAIAVRCSVRAFVRVSYLSSETHLTFLSQLSLATPVSDQLPIHLPF